MNSGAECGTGDQPGGQSTNDLQDWEEKVERDDVGWESSTPEGDCKYRLTYTQVVYHGAFVEKNPM